MFRDDGLSLLSIITPQGARSTLAGRARARSTVTGIPYPASHGKLLRNEFKS